MKNIYALFLISFFVLNSLSSFSQNFRGGISAGLVTSQVAGDQLSGYNKAGLNIGLWTNYPISDRSSIQLELNYTMKGSQDNPGKDKTSSYKLHVDYIQLPIFYQLELFPKFRIEGGLALGINVRHYEEENSLEYNSKNFNTFTLSSIVGVSYQFSKRIKLALMTNNDLTPLRNSGPRMTGVTRFGNDHGQFNDLLLLNLYFSL